MRLRHVRDHRRGRGKRTAFALIVAAPLLTLAHPTPATACVFDPDPFFGVLGEAAIVGSSPVMFADGTFLLEHDARYTLHDADLNPLFPVGQQFAQVDDFFWDGASLRDRTGTVVGPSPIKPVGVSTTGTVVFHRASGGTRQVEIARFDNTLDTRYSGDGIIPYTQLVPAGIPIDAVIGTAGVRFVGDVIDLYLFSIDRPASQSKVWVTRITPSTVTNSGVATVEGTISLESAPNVVDQRSLLAMERTGDSPLAAYVQWATPPAPTVSMVGSGEGLRPWVLPAGNSTGWWIVLPFFDYKDLLFVDSHGSIDAGLGRIRLPIFNSVPLSSPDGSLRWPGENVLMQVKGHQPPARFIVGGLTDQIARLYRAGLGRTPDPAGLAHWRTVRASGVGLEQIANAFIGSPEFQSRFAGLANRAFVDQLYQFVLGRVGDPGGVAYWTSRLDGGLSRARLLVEFSESDENVFATATLPTDEPEAGFYRLYQAYFQRDPDVGGLCFFTQPFSSSMPTAALRGPADFFAASPEFAARYGAVADAEFVRLIYRNVLGRSPDAAGGAYWQNQLARGMTRGTMMIGFSESAEFRLKTDTVPTTPD